MNLDILLDGVPLTLMEIFYWFVHPGQIIVFLVVIGIMYEFKKEKLEMLFPIYNKDVMSWIRKKLNDD